METKQTATVKRILSGLGKEEREQIIKASCLTSKEQQVLIFRFSDGLQVKESAEKLNMETEAFNKLQKKALFKFYYWLDRKARLKGVFLDELS